ncbi:FmdB family zinc ribbon protein [Trujillonella endophytica]|uniref:Putative regulatory protein, FmdB family n=1 Tax=Trujillonella endophytica TaxID=673521 RepID=A0A1H8SMS8_9ACTN|nr:FmdB family zinc ribbon protein [Trujillella endophytica]SEO79885.1 putative regulatory protein, FmdB family [Trujillella endophytica]
MPTYQYACTNPDGKHEFEVVQSFTDAPVTECPECGAVVRKVYGSVGVVFKGSGFYRTDSRGSSTASEKPASSAPAASGSDSGSGNGSGAKKESASTTSSSSSGSGSGSGAKAASAG